MRIKVVPFLFVIAALGMFISSCRKPIGQRLREEESSLLKQYITKYHKDAVPTASGLYYIETKAGTLTDTIKTGDLVKVFYRGYLIQDTAKTGVGDGYEFDYSGVYEPFSFTVGAGSVISGWDEAIKLMHVGGEAKLIIPSGLGYGGTSQSSIPAYSTLVFYISVYKHYKSTDTWPTIEIIPPSMKK